MQSVVFTGHVSRQINRLYVLRMTVKLAYCSFKVRCDDVCSRDLAIFYYASCCLVVCLCILTFVKQTNDGRVNARIKHFSCFRLRYVLFSRRHKRRKLNRRRKRRRYINEIFRSSGSASDELILMSTRFHGDIRVLRFRLRSLRHS